MKTKLKKPLLIISVAALVFSSCTTTSRMMREPNVRVNLEMKDFELSEQVTATATQRKIIGIDWSRLFHTESGKIQQSDPISINLAAIPVVGKPVRDQTYNFALYNLMAENPGYDVVYYPQFEAIHKKPLGFGLIIRTTTVNVTARLGKLKNQD